MYAYEGGGSVPEDVVDAIVYDGVTKICRYFSARSSLKAISLPSSLMTIGDGAFKGCSSLGTITIPSSMKTINYEAFHGCSSLTTVKLPSSITWIGKNAFFGCSSLETITLPSSIVEIAEDAFDGCTRLRSITLGKMETTACEEGEKDGGSGLLWKALERHGNFHALRLESVLGYDSYDGRDDTSTSSSVCVCDDYHYHDWSNSVKKIDSLGRLTLAIAAECDVPWSSPRSRDGDGGWFQ